MFLPSLILSLVAASVIWLLGRKNPARDPRVTGGVLLLLLLLPLLSFLPKHEIIVSPDSRLTNLSWSFGGIWMIGFVLFSLRSLMDVIAMQRWKKASRTIELPLLEQTKEELGYTGKVALRSHSALASPVVSGILRPTIYLPEEAETWPELTLKMALLHELGHLQRRDLWLAGAARISCLFHWFNPMVWWLRRALLSQCEYACDAYLIKRGTDRKSYAHALCDVAENSSISSPALTMAMAGHVPLRERITQLGKEKRSGSILIMTLLTLVGSSAVAMSVVGFVPQQIAPIFEEEIQLRMTANPFPLD